MTCAVTCHNYALSHIKKEKDNKSCSVKKGLNASAKKRFYSGQPAQSAQADMSRNFLP